MGGKEMQLPQGKESTSSPCYLDSSMGEVAIIEKENINNRWSLDIYYGRQGMSKQIYTNSKGKVVVKKDALLIPLETI
jgi:hypothetical protein